MRATCWFGVGDIRVADVPDPQIINPRDAVIRVTLTAICGSDLHLYDGFIPTMKRGDVLGHEFMGEVVEVGSAVTNLAPGDRVVVPFNIACGNCFFCRADQWSLCDNSNPKPETATALYGHSPAGLFGYSHMMGGYAGGQAEYVRVPFADVGPLKIPDGIPDEKVLFLSDIFPTGYQAAENCGIEPGDTVAVWGCGPVGQFAIRSALLLGAERVVAIDHHPGRLDLATQNGLRNHNGSVETLNFDEADVYDALMSLTGGRGPDRCIDAVGLEAHGAAIDNLYDRVKVATRLATDRIHVLRQIARCCRKGGAISVPGVYGGFADKFPIGAVFEKGLTVRTGQTHVHRYMRPLLERIERDEIDPSFVISHRLGLDDAPEAYAEFKNHQDECFKVVMRP
jgi:threonine dehydrogenase-like Zn-dependent dehydrogenase